jgi:hypothetical protein
MKLFYGMVLFVHQVFSQLLFLILHPQINIKQLNKLIITYTTKI